MTFEVVKSVGRVFEVLELFKRDKCALSPTEISKELRYPLASTHAILKSMHHLGYLEFHNKNKKYIPSRLVVDLVGWLPDSLDNELSLLDFVKDLNHETKETINISKHYGANMRIIYAIESVYPIGVSVKVGANMPLLHSLTGIAAYGCLGEPERRSVKQLTKDLSIMHPVDQDKIEEICIELQQNGTVSRCGLAMQGIGVVCLPVKLKHNDDFVIVGVIGPSDRISESEEKYVRIISRLAAKHKIETSFKINRK